MTRQTMTRPHSTRSNDRTTVLVVDDDVFCRSFLTRILLQLGVDVAHAVDGDVAPQRVEELRPALVFMDIEMPRESGLSATRRIRSLHSEAARVPVVGVSASTVEESSCLEAGMGGLIRKPISRSMVERSLRAAGLEFEAVA